MKKILNNLKNHKKVFGVAAVFLVLFFVMEAKPKTFVTLEESNIFSEYSFEAESVLIIDQTTGKKIYQKNSGEVFEIASITKVMTALIAMEEMTGSNIAIDPESYFTVGDTGLLIDEEWNLENLVSFMLVNSSNDAAEAIAKSYYRGRNRFVERMNDRSTELGLELVFNNPTGLNETDDFGGRGSAEDVASLFSYTYEKFPEAFAGTRESRFSISSQNKEHSAENTNLFANALSGLQAGKTGYTDRSGGSLVTRFNIGLNKPFVAVVLGTEGREVRFYEMQKVIRSVAEYSLTNN